MFRLNPHDEGSNPKSKSQGSGDPYYLNFDGLCEPQNPGGIATYGIVIRKGGLTELEEGGLAFAEPWSEDASNNVAEYSGLIRGLEWLLAEGHSGDLVVARGDSSLVINQLNGKFKVKAIRIVELYKRALTLIERFRKLRIEWVDRSLNKEADLQSRIAFARLKKQFPPSAQRKARLGDKGRFLSS